MFENGHMDHYVPQWLMRNWCDSKNEIWCFDKRSQSIKNKGTTSFGREKDLNKSDVIDIDLEATVFAELDNRYGRYTRSMLLLGAASEGKRVPNRVMRFFVELCLWTSVRNRRTQGWIDIADFRTRLNGNSILQACTDEELRKCVHLLFCKHCHDSLMRAEIRRLMRTCFYFFVLGEGRLITSDMPVQEIGSESAESLLDCDPIADDECSLIMFPIHPSIMFVATRHKDYADCHRKFVIDDDLIRANYTAQINSDSHELYFPYPIYLPDSISDRQVAKHILERFNGVPCAVDLEQFKKDKTVSIVHSNWSGA